MNIELLTILVLGLIFLITDEMLTRIGLRLGCKESNRVFNFLKKKKGENFAHSIITVLGLTVLIGMAMLFQSVLLLSLFAVGFAVPVILNAFVIWHRLVSVIVIKRSSNGKIDNPPTA